MSAEIINWLFFPAFTILSGITLYVWSCRQERKRKLVVYMTVVDAQRNLLEVLIQEGIVPEKCTGSLTKQQNKIVDADIKLVVALAKLRNEI